MPTYDYLCAANGQVVEVAHSMNERLSTWGELCAHAGLGHGDTPAEAPVRKLISGGHVVRNTSLGSAPPCQSGGPCQGGLCGLN